MFFYIFIAGFLLKIPLKRDLNRSFILYENVYRMRISDTDYLFIIIIIIIIIIILLCEAYSNITPLFYISMTIYIT